MVEKYFIYIHILFVIIRDKNILTFDYNTPRERKLLLTFSLSFVMALLVLIEILKSVKMKLENLNFFIFVISK